MDKVMIKALKNKRKTLLFVFLAITLVLATWYKLKIQGITLTEETNTEITETASNNEASDEQPISTTFNLKSTAKSSTLQQITINYKVDFSTTATGLDEDYKYDDEGIENPTVQGGTTYTITINNGESTTIENLSKKYATPYDQAQTVSKDKAVLEFLGWKVNNSSTVQIQPETELTWEQLSSYANNGVINLTTKWDLKEIYETVNFYINYKSQALDTEGNIIDQGTAPFTPSLWAAYVGNASATHDYDIADKTSDNSFTIDKTVRAMEGDKNNGSVFVYDFPSDEHILKKLKDYAENLTVDGQAVDENELNLEHYAIRWYVFKYIDADGYHIDGKLVRKEGKMTVTKTFTGSKKALEKVSGYDFDTSTNTGNTSYYINVKGGDTDLNLYTKNNALHCSKKEHTHTEKCFEKQSLLKCTKEHTHSSDCYVQIDGVICGKLEHTHTSPTCYVKVSNESYTVDEATTYKLTYTWVVDTKYGINYTVTEKNYNVTTTDDNGNIENYIIETNYEVIDPDSSQTKEQTIGNSAHAMGVNNYTIDSKDPVDTSKIIAINFTNTYMPISAIKIKKEDSITNNPLANAEFSIYLMDSKGNYDNKLPLKFTYDEGIYTYAENGDKTILITSQEGLITINKLPIGKKYKLIETSVPDGYNQESAIGVTLDVKQTGEIVPEITAGTGRGYDATIKTLKIYNISRLTNVKVTKKWNEVPENYIKPVTIDLYLNNTPISSYNLGDSIVQTQILDKQTNQWSYEWSNLPLYINGARAIYSVRETKIGDLNAVTEGVYDSTQGIWKSKDAYTQYRAQTTPQKYYNSNNQEITDNNKIGKETKLISIDLVNTLHLVKINVNKTSPLGNVIDGVKFQLQKIDESGNIDSTFEARTLITSEEGKLSFVDLEYNTKYVLTEIEGNKGYYLDSTPIYVIIKKVEEDVDELILYKDNTFTEEAVEGDYEYVSLNEQKTELNVINIPYTPMPKAGGSGVYGFYILGIFLMGSSIIIIYLKTNKIKKGR